MADQISDAILDDLLRQDPRSRVAVETMLTTGQVHVAGEVTTEGFADVIRLVRDIAMTPPVHASVAPHCEPHPRTCRHSAQQPPKPSRKLQR